MNRGPKSGGATVDHVARATSAWGDAPDWIIVLAEACAKSSQSAVARRLDYSGSAISAVLSNSYRGDVDRIEQMVRGVLMAETLPCPVLGALPRNQCLEWQARPYAATSSHRVAMYRACRDACPHSRIKSQLHEEDTP